ncbi:hypothetical protein SISNIDRAFT_421844, partial [Sistotremastrum niveocremeum HHB9708]
MSRLTASEVIDLGKYLEDGFDPTTLTIPHLLSILSHHNVNRPPQANKGKLLQTFNEEIVPNRARFRKERIAAEESEASVQGIHDGYTGEQLSEEEPAPRPLRRSTRASSRGVSIEPTQSLETPKPKPRRASAGPQATRQNSKILPRTTQPTVIEISESEEDEPARRRSTKPDPARSKRRVSSKIGTGTEDSPWEDTNVFQQGPDSSSPVRTPALKTTPKLRKRASMSAPPESPVNASPLAKREPISPRVPFGEVTPSGRASWIGNESMQVQRELLDNDADESFKLDQGETGSLQEDLDTFDEHNAVVSQKLAGLDVDVVPKAKPEVEPIIPRWLKTLVTIILAISALAVVPYKDDSKVLGFCDTGSNTNQYLETRKIELAQAQECKQSVAKLLGNDSEEGISNEVTPFVCSSVNPSALPESFDFIDYPRALTCTPCPAHGNCSGHNITCDKSFTLKEHPLKSIPYLDAILDGLPGIGPIALPPSCVDDDRRKKKVKRLVKDLEAYLASLKGERQCAGVTGEAAQDENYGATIEQLRNTQRKMLERQRQQHRQPVPGPVDDRFDDEFDEAIAELERYGWVIPGIDKNGEKFVVAERTEMNVVCKIKVGTWATWEQWRATLFGLIGLVFTTLLGRYQLHARRLEAARVAELVQTSLELIRQQEIAYHTDPVTCPYPWLSPLQLRDLVLQDEHSVVARKRLWDKVERVVEGNANVRANLEDVEGDEARVWRWVGSA